MAAKDDVLQAAKKLFACYGYHKTTMSSVVKEANVAKGTLYWHFSSKRELFIAILENSLQEYFIFLKDIKNNSKLSCRQKIAQIIDNRIDILEEYQPVVKELMSNQEEIDQDFKSRMKKLKKEHLELLVAIFAQGKDSGEFNIEDPYVTALAFIGMNFSLANQRQLLDEVSTEKINKELKNLLFKGVLSTLEKE